MNGQVALFLPSGDRYGSGLYALAVELARPADAVAIDAVVSIMSRLEAAGRQGAFPAPGNAPLTSHMQLSLNRRENERCLIFEADLRSVDLHAFELLRNMAQRLLRRGIEVRELRLSEAGGVPGQSYRKPPPDELQDRDAYPGVARIGFGVETAEFVDTCMRRVLIELFMPVTADHVLRLRALVEPWFGLLEAGAYAMPVGPSTDVDSLRGDVELFDELTVELTVNRFQASESAWAALANLLDTCWKDSSTIAQLMIE